MWLACRSSGMKRDFVIQNSLRGYGIGQGALDLLALNNCCRGVVRWRHISFIWICCLFCYCLLAIRHRLPSHDTAHDSPFSILNWNIPHLLLLHRVRHAWGGTCLFRRCQVRLVLACCSRNLLKISPEAVWWIWRWAEWSQSLALSNAAAIDQLSLIVLSQDATANDATALLTTRRIRGHSCTRS